MISGRTFIRCLGLVSLTVSLCGANARAAEPSELLIKMDGVLRGQSNQMTVTIDVRTPDWERHYKLNVWMKGVDLTFARVLEPAKVAGQGFLRQKARLWNYLPDAERTVLIPPSMMLDRFMGSDFSNDDFVKLSYFARDYEGKIVGKETLDTLDTYHLELMPKPDAPVTYGKLEVWLRTTDAAPVMVRFYNEKMELIRTLYYSVFKAFGTHEIPTVWTMENDVEKGRETTITILDASFDQDIPESLFSKENLERVS